MCTYADRHRRAAEEEVEEEEAAGMGGMPIASHGINANSVPARASARALSFTVSSLHYRPLEREEHRTHGRVLTLAPHALPPHTIDAEDREMKGEEMN